MKRWHTILKERKYFGRSACGVVILAQDTGRILTVQRAKKVMNGGTWSVTVSGKIDDGENVIQAAKREMREELKYKGEIIKLSLLDTFQDKNDMEDFEGNFTFYTLKMIVPEEFKPKLNWENRKAFWWDGKGKIKGPLHFGTLRLLKLKYQEIFKR
jgi:ADP-ribose pyrophosphatase YjhB (NUDIX family)